MCVCVCESISSSEGRGKEEVYHCRVCVVFPSNGSVGRKATYICLWIDFGHDTCTGDEPGEQHGADECNVGTLSLDIFERHSDGDLVLARVQYPFVEGTCDGGQACEKVGEYYAAVFKQTKPSILSHGQQSDEEVDTRRR